ncbi:MAG: sulfatase-like hydrolase/transferase [Chloroflexi bacterium]|nr:sulfatase-like hydrolase/transferase [Chloroflexota bacterium]
MAKRPNVLIFMVDQQRSDACGCFGSQACRTPGLDRLAAEGIRFTHAYTSTTLCTPARASFWTGLWPTHHGLLINTHWRHPVTKGRLDEGVATLATIFRSAGYATAHFGKWHVGPDSDMPRLGFEHVVTRQDFADARLSLTRGAGQRFELRDVVERGYIVANYPFAGITSADGEDFLEIWLCRRAEEWLAEQARHQGRPFLGCISLPGPHPGYVVPERCAAMYDPDAMPLWPNVDDALEDKPAVHRFFRDNVTRSGTLTHAEWRTCIARYYAFVTLIDEQLGRMLRLLDDLDLAKDTLVLFVTDHGDLIGAHGLWDKGPTMYDEQLHIPIVARYPDVIAAGSTCDAMVSLMDVMPTLVEAAGLALPAPVDARSLWPFFLGQTMADWPDDVYVQYHGEGISLYTMRAVRTRRHKYVYYPYDRHELYDEEADPWELRNRSEDPAYASVLEEMKGRMAAWAERSADVVVEWNVGITPMRQRS